MTKKPFNVLSKSAIAAALATSALVPAAVFAAEDNATLKVSDYIIEHEGQLYSVDVDTYLEMKAGQISLAPKYIITASGKVYDLDDYLEAKASDIGTTMQEALELLDAEPELEKDVEYGNVEVDENGQPIYKPAPTAPVELTVESVSAINNTGVEVTFPEVTTAIENANVTVKDGKGNVVPTEAKLVAEGETSAEFLFTTPFAEDYEFTGVWTVNGVEVNFDAANQLADIVDAVTKGNQIDLQTALDAAGITYADETRIADYLSELREDGATASLEAVQKAITKVDEAAATKTEKETAVNAVANAKTQAQLLKALQDNFKLVNPEWIVNYANPVIEVEGEPTAETAGNADLLAWDIEEGSTVADNYDAIQEAVYGTNLSKVAPKVAAANMSLDSKKVSEAKTLVSKWIPEVAADEVSIFAGLKEKSLDLLSLEDALIAVDQAKTNSALKAALVGLDKLETELIEKYPTAGLEKEFDIETVKDANLTAYRTAIAGAELGAKNQRKDIQKIVKDANDAAVADAKAAVLEDLNKVDSKTSAATVVSLLEKNQELNDLANEVKPAYAEAYKTAVVAAVADDAELADANAVNTLIGNVNNTEDAKARLAAVNSASTASEMSKALIALEAAKGTTDFTNLSSTAKLEVAEIVLATRNAEDDKKFADKDAALASITTAETGAIAVRTAFLADVNDETEIAGVQAVLAGEGSLLPEFAKLDPAAQVEKAEAVLNALTALKADGKAGFSTVTEIKTIVE